MVERVSHDSRTIVVKKAARGIKPSWGGFMPLMLSFEVSQRIAKLLTDATRYPYADARAMKHIEDQRAELGGLLRRGGLALQVDDGTARWWTFAGGRINHTLKYGLGLAEGWKVVADNFLLRIEGDGVTHDTVREAIEKIRAPGFWTGPGAREQVLSRLPAYRLSKFQDCLPERFALEMVGGVPAGHRWVGSVVGRRSPGELATRD